MVLSITYKKTKTIMAKHKKYSARDVFDPQVTVVGLKKGKEMNEKQHIRKITPLSETALKEGITCPFR